MSGPGVLQSCGVVGPSDVPAPRPGIYALQALKSRSESGVAPLLSTPVASSPLQAEPKDIIIDELEALLCREEHARRGWPAWWGTSGLGLAADPARTAGIFETAESMKT